MPLCCPYRVFQPPLVIAPGYCHTQHEFFFDTPHESLSPASSPRSCGGRDSDETSALSSSEDETWAPARPQDETSALLRSEYDTLAPGRPEGDDQQENKTKVDTQHPKLAPPTSAVEVAPVAGIGCISCPDVEIELKTDAVAVQTEKKALSGVNFRALEVEGR